MLESLRLTQNRLIEDTDTRHYRFLYEKLNLKSRLSGLIGPRGVGKTTLLLQYLKNHPDLLPTSFYFSADHIYFSQISLYQFVEDLYLTAGIKNFFIDEIHKYGNWAQELKNLYDGFPAIKIIFSGSSSLDLVKGSHDLSRRTVLNRLPGMSFREYLNFNHNMTIPVISYQQLIESTHDLNTTISRIDRIKGCFSDYLRQGYYPFSIEDPQNYNEKLLRIIDKTIHEDIANFYKLKTENLYLFKKILVFLASIPPGKINTHNIAKNLATNDHTITNYLTILKETGLAHLIYALGSGNVALRKPEKIFLDNTNLQYALSKDFGKDIEIGTIRELLFIQMLLGAGINVYFSQRGDYSVEGTVFEIGGPNKTRKQIKSNAKAILVKDDLTSLSKKVIPLIYFGFLY